MKKFPTIISDIMSSPVMMVDKGISVREAAEKMTQKNMGNDRG